jgi:NADH-quinone oxidoreductase subunit L
MAQALGFAAVHHEHALLFLLPLATVFITTFYMLRMWFLTFTGKPRDEHVYEHAHESPWTMTVPLVVLAVGSIAVAWGWPLWDARQSALEHHIHHAMPRAVLADFGHLIEEPERETWPEEAAKLEETSERHHAHKYHNVAGYLALLMVALGIVFGSAVYLHGLLDANEAVAQFPRLHAFLMNKWHFDDLYRVALVRPALVVARYCRSFDLSAIDGIIHSVARATVRVSRWDGRFDNGFIDWLVNLVGNTTYAIGAWMRNFQTGYLRSYVLFLVLAAVGIFIALSYFVSLASAG